MFILPFSKPPKWSLLTILTSAFVWALPTPGFDRETTPSENPDVAGDLVPRTVTTISSADISGFTSFTQFAGAAYCDPAAVETWTCGGEPLIVRNRHLANKNCPLFFLAGACSANPGFQPTLTGGNGADVPHCALLPHPQAFEVDQRPVS